MKLNRKSLPEQLSKTKAVASFLSACGSFTMGIWLTLPMALGAMWWPKFGGVAVFILALSCWFRFIGIREMNRGFHFGGLHIPVMIRVWQVMNFITAIIGIVVAIIVLLQSGDHAFDEQTLNYFIQIQNIWLLLLVGELVITTRVVSAIALWMEATWMRVTQTLVAWMIGFALAVRLALVIVPTPTTDMNMEPLLRAGAILAAAGIGVIAIWWLADGVNRMAMALADKARDETFSAG
jgi:hypothetical protein